MVDGRTVTHTFEAKSETEAIAWVVEWEKRPELLDAGAWEFEARRYAAEAVAEKKLSEGYAEDRLGTLLREGLVMGLVSPRGLSTGMLQSWYDDAVDGKLPLLDKAGEPVLDEAGEPKVRKVGVTTANHYMKHFRVFCDWLVSESRILESPVDDVTVLPDPENERNEFLEASGVAKVLVAAREQWDPKFEKYPTLELFFLLTCECGMRKGEADAARDAWVDVDRGVIVIPAEDEFEGRKWYRKGVAGKRKKAVVPMVPELREWFEEHGVPSPFLLKPDISWKKYRYRYQITTRVVRFLKKRGLGHLTLHDLRRSFGSNRVSNGVSIEKVANWMGITRQTAWDRYARFVEQDDEVEKGSAREAGSSSGSQVDGVRERLQELKGLLDDGLIDQEDFELKKGEILRGL